MREFEAIQTHENAHVAFLVNALGANARPKPSFVDLTQPNLVTFAQTSRSLENTGVGAYLGAAPIIFNTAYLAAAGSILTIEARHSGYINVLLNKIMTDNVDGDVVNFDVPLTQEQVVANAGPLITSLNGGPPLAFSTTPSAENDIAILNFPWLSSTWRPSSTTSTCLASPETTLNIRFKPAYRRRGDGELTHIDREFTSPRLLRCGSRSSASVLWTSFKELSHINNVDDYSRGRRRHACLQLGLRETSPAVDDRQTAS